MKLTKTGLKQIIKEELSNVLMLESISMEVVDMLDNAIEQALQVLEPISMLGNAIEHARREIIQSHPSQTGIEQRDKRGEPYEGDPSEAAAEWIVGYVQEVLGKLRPVEGDASEAAAKAKAKWIMEYVQEVLGNFESDPLPPKRQTGRDYLRLVQEKLKGIN